MKMTVKKVEYMTLSKVLCKSHRAFPFHLVNTERSAVFAEIIERRGFPALNQTDLFICCNLLTINSQ